MVLASLTTFHTATIEGIRVWQEYNIGEARFIKCREFNLPRKISTSQIMKVTKDNTSPKATFRKMKARGPAAEHLNRKSRAEKPNSSPQEAKLFQCPNYGYAKSFQQFSSLQRHVDVGKHKYVLERVTLLDKAMQSYATKLVQRNVGLESQPRGEPGTSRILSSIPRLNAGGSNHQLYNGKGLNKVRGSTSSVLIWEGSVATKSML